MLQNAHVTYSTGNSFGSSKPLRTKPFNMDKLDELNVFFKCFTIFGHKIESENPDQSKYSLVFTRLIRKLVYCVFVINAAFFVFTKRKWWSSDNGISFLTTRMFLVLLSLSISLYMDMMYPMSSNVIYTNIGTMLKRVEYRLNVNISLQSVIRAMHSKVLVTYAIQAISFLINMALLLDSSHNVDTDISTNMVFAYRDWMSLYFVFYIDLFTLLLDALNKGIERVTIPNQSIDVKLQTVHTTKWLYYHLWKTANIFNKR